MCILSTAFPNVSAHHPPSPSNPSHPSPPIFPYFSISPLTESWSKQARSSVARRFAVFFPFAAVRHRLGILILRVILNLENSIFAMFACAAVVVMDQIDELKSKLIEAYNVRARRFDENSFEWKLNL